MTVNAGFSGTIEVSDDQGSTWTDLSDGSNNVDSNFIKELLEITNFDDTARNRIAGLEDKTVTVSGDEDWGDSGQDMIRTQALAGSDIYFRVLSDGTNGFVFPVLLEGYQSSNAPDGTPTYSVTGQGIAAAVTTVP
jgi:hypothetical protein